MDNRTKEARSRNMSRIPSKNTKPEETVRKYLFNQGFRYRKNVSKLPGKPDIVLPKYKTVVFGTLTKVVNGLFHLKVTKIFGKKSLLIILSETSAIMKNCMKWVGKSL